MDYKAQEQDRLRAALKLQEAKEKASQYSLLNKQHNHYKYFIAPGNNASLLKKLMQLRDSRWEETTAFDKGFNFRWQPLSRGLGFTAIN